MHILAFEPFDDGSHRAVRESITRHSAFDWSWYTRPGKSWNWRMRTAAIEMVGEVKATGGVERTIDAIFTTSLLSVADLRAMLPATHRAIPIILYMHENQVAYPADPFLLSGDPQKSAEREQRDHHYALTNLTSVLAADTVIWNSQWNRDSFFDGIGAVLKLQPDRAITNELLQVLKDDSHVVWPPVEMDKDRFNRTRNRTSEDARVLHNPPGDGKPEPVRIVWPHRWEHDKGPDGLLALARRWTAELNIQWVILGQRFPKIPPAMAEFLDEFNDHIDHAGFIEERNEYLNLLESCDWVLSTARHEYFGIAVVEAMFCGCLPWLPSALSYPELLPECARGLHPAHFTEHEVEVRSALCDHLTDALAPNAARALDECIVSTTTMI